MGTPPTSWRAEELLAHDDWLRRLARGLTADAHAAEDGIQETWRAALEHPPRAGVDPRPWLARVLRHNVFERGRRDATRRRREERAARRDALPSHEEVVEAIEIRALLLGLLRALDEPYRTTLFLRYVEGLSAAEIARREDVPAGTVRARAARGLDLLRARLDERCDGRRMWFASVAALSGRELAPPLVLGSLVSGGLVTMSGMAKVCVGLAVVTAIGAGVWLVREVASTAPERGEAVSAARHAASMGTPGEPELEPQAAESARIPAERVARPAEAVATEAPAVSVPIAPARLVVRFVDERGVGLPDVVLMQAGAARDYIAFEAKSDARGEIEHAVELRFPAATATLRAEHSERARWLGEVRLDTGATTHLGEVVLVPCGRVSGVVLDAGGHGVAGANVCVGPPEAQNRDPEDLRRNGPWFGPATLSVAFRTSTDERGRFLLENVPVGAHRAWAGLSGLPWSSSEVFELERSEDVDVEIALEASRAGAVLRGVVLDPQGNPLPYLIIEAFCEAPSRRWRSKSSSNAEGRFAVLTEHDLPHELRAKVTDGRFACAYAFDVMPGEEEVVLQFSAPRELAVSARGTDGEDVDHFYATLRFPGEQRPHFLELSQRAREGVVRLMVPPRSFELEIDAPGYVPDRVGPLAPEMVPASLEVELAPAPGVRGRVTADGVPVPHAQLVLGRLDTDDAYWTDGFQCRFTFGKFAYGLSDAEGAFVLDLREPGRYVVLAHHTQYASAELGPLDLVPALGVRDLELVLTSGGALEGRVLLPEGAEAAGRIVGISRGDGRPRTTRADEEGRYRFEHLTPGPWQVVLRETEILPDRGVGASGSARDLPPIVWDCELFEGRTTRHDLVVESDG